MTGGTERTYARAADIVRARVADAEPVLGPHPAPCVCGAPRWEHAGSERSGKHATNGCRRYRADVAHEIADRAIDGMGRRIITDYLAHEREQRAASRARRGPRPKGQWGVSLSDLGNCRRAIQYREAPPDDLIRLPERRNEAALGSMLHKAVQEARAALYPWRRFEERVPLTEYGLDASTKHDEYDPLTRVYIEYKTAGRATWDYVQEHGYRPAHRQQAQTNALILTERGDPVDTVVVHYLNRENGSEAPHVEPFDPQVGKDALAYLGDIVTALDLYADGGEELPRDHSGPTNDPICQRCPFRATCWDMTRAEALGRTPESLAWLGPSASTLAISDEDAANIETLLAEYQRHGASEREAKEAKAQIKALLGGVPYGRYGDLRWVDSGSERANQGAYVKALLAAWSNGDDLTKVEVPTAYVRSEKVYKARKTDRPVIDVARETLAAQAAADAVEDEPRAAS